MEFFLDLVVLVLVLAALALTYMILWQRWTLKKTPEFSRYGELEELADGSWRRTIKCKSRKQVTLKLTWEFQQLEFFLEIPPRVQCIFKGRNLGTLTPGVQGESKGLERLGPRQYVPLAVVKNMPLDFKLIEPYEEEIEREVEIDVDYRLDWIDSEGSTGSWAENDYMKFMPPSRRMPKPIEPEEATPSDENLEEYAREYSPREDLQEVAEEAWELESRLEESAPAPDEPDGGAEMFAPAPGLLPAVVGLLPERALLTLVNWWWQNPRVSRTTFFQQLVQSGSNIEFYDMKGVIDNLSKLAESTYSFEPAPRVGGWLWVPVGAGDFCTVPAVAKFFRVGEAMSILRRMFEGIGEAPSDFVFDRVEKACRLRRVSNQPSKYTLIERGRLSLRTADDRPLAAEPPPVGTAGMPFVHSDASARQTRDVEASAQRHETRLSSLHDSLNRSADSESEMDLTGLRKELRDNVASELQGVRRSVRIVQGVVSKLQDSMATLAEGQRSRLDELTSAVQSLGGHIDDLESRHLAASKTAEQSEGRIEGLEGQLGKIGGVLSDLLSRVESVAELGDRLEVLESSVFRLQSQRGARRSSSGSLQAPAAVPQPDESAGQRSELELPEGWETALRKAASGRPPDTEDNRIARVFRLQQLAESLRRQVSAEGAGWAVHVVHPQLGLELGELIIEPVTIRGRRVPPAGGLEVRNQNDRPLPVICYVQLFVQLSRTGSDESFLFLPHGPFSASDYRRPYLLLIEDPPEAPVFTRDVVQPARLLRQPVTQRYRVVEKMRIVYATAEA